MINNIPLILEDSQIETELRKERIMIESGFLSLALVLIFIPDLEWIKLFGFFLAGSSIAFLKSNWVRILALSIVMFIVLGGIVRADSILLLSLIFLGTIATLQFSPWYSECCNFFNPYYESKLRKWFETENQRRLFRILVRDFSPVIGFLLCVYFVFGLLGYLGEIVTITIIAVLAWFAKMERHYASSFTYGSSIGEGLGEENFTKLLYTVNPPLFSMRAFPPATEDINPTIYVGIATYKHGPIHFAIWAEHCPTALDNIKPKPYKFTDALSLLKDVEEIIEKEKTSRNDSDLWYIDWRFFEKMTDTPLGYNIVYSSMRIPGEYPPHFIMVLTVFYIWYSIRYRYEPLARFVSFIGKNMGKILFIFKESDGFARKTNLKSSHDS